MQATILVFDDHPLIFDGIRLQLGAFYDLHYAATGAQLQEKMAAMKFDIVLLDLDFPGNESGFDYLDAVKANGAKVIVLTGTATTHKLRRCYKANLAGYLEKHDMSADLCDTVRVVLTGQQVFPFSRVKRLLAEATDRLPHLTERERDVLDVMCADPGSSIKQIAHKLGLSVARVGRLAEQIAEKFEVQGLLRAYLEAKRRGYFSGTVLH
jgi:DNA-binding NarL/FixJ family response regulator